jgi:hypothetical protein
MRTLRTYLIVASLLAFAGQGFAAALHVRNCSMKQTQAQLIVSVTAIAGDCCDDGAGKNIPCEKFDGARSAKTQDGCSLCHACYSVQSAQGIDPVRLTATPVVLIPLEVPSPAFTPLPSHRPASLWRPPALI